MARVNLPAGETVVRLRAATTEDPYSGESDGALDWSNPTELTITGCGFDPGGSFENTEARRDAITTQPTLYAPADADITANDRVQVRSLTYDVQGHPALWRSPFTGWTPGIAVTLRLFEG